MKVNTDLRGTYMVSYDPDSVSPAFWFGVYNSPTNKFRIRLAKKSVNSVEVHRENGYTKVNCLTITEFRDRMEQVYKVGWILDSNIQIAKTKNETFDNATGSDQEAGTLLGGESNSIGFGLLGSYSMRIPDFIFTFALFIFLLFGLFGYHSVKKYFK